MMWRVHRDRHADVGGWQHTHAARGWYGLRSRQLILLVPSALLWSAADGRREWLVQDGTGVFAGLTGGGVNTLRITGARLAAMYIGTLGA